jgi:uncharacterized protein DUF2834
VVFSLQSASRSSFGRAGTAFLAIGIAGFIAVTFCIARLWLSDDPAWGVRFLDSIFASWASTLFFVDLLVALGAGMVWVAIESRRLGMRWRLWLVLMVTTPIAFSFPLFLAYRERMIGGERNRLMP